MFLVDPSNNLTFSSSSSISVQDPPVTGWKENTRTSIVLQRHSVTSQSARGFAFDPGIKWRVCYFPVHHTWLTWLWSWREITTRTILPDASKESSCPVEFPCARPKRRKIGAPTTCSFSGCEVFDPGTAQKPVPLKTSWRLCRRGPTRCEQFPASSSSPDRCRRQGLRFRRMCITLVSGMPGGIRYCITNNTECIRNLKLHAIAVFSFQAGVKTMFA